MRSADSTTKAELDIGQPCDEMEIAHDCFIREDHGDGERGTGGRAYEDSTFAMRSWKAQKHCKER
jgi:hypothetical protein